MVAHEEFKGIAGFKISGLYSPWTALSDGVREFLSVKKNPEQLKVWTNTYLGESWVDAGETIDQYSLSERREPWMKCQKMLHFLRLGSIARMTD